jgi:hypothetical protein
VLAKGGPSAADGNGTSGATAPSNGFVGDASFKGGDGGDGNGTTIQ